MLENPEPKFFVSAGPGVASRSRLRPGGAGLQDCPVRPIGYQDTDPAWIEKIMDITVLLYTVLARKQQYISHSGRHCSPP